MFFRFVSSLFLLVVLLAIFNSEWVASKIDNKISNKETNKIVKRTRGNCNEWNISFYKELLKDWTIFKNKKIITKDVFSKSIENLEKYCDNEKDTLQTPIFLNQLIDISFRKIDWIEWAAYWVELDPLWLEYRKTLNEIEKEYSTDPEEIKKLFKLSWGSPTDNIESNNKTLYWKYNLACDEILSISDKLLSAKGPNNKINTLYNWVFKKRCYKLANKRYLDETRLIMWIIRQNLYNYAEQWMYKKLNEEFTIKIGKLFDSMMETLWLLDYVARRFMHGTDVQDK